MNFKNLAAIVIIMFCFSCDIQKKAIKKKTDRNFTESIRKTTYRKGDTITIEVPNIIYKDTIIEKINYENKTIARITYDDKGNAKFDCIESQLKETLEINRQLFEVIKTKDKEKTEEFDSSIVLYGFIGLTLIVGVVAFFGFRFLNQNTALMNKIADKL